MNANSDRSSRRRTPSPIGSSLVLWTTLAAMLGAAGLEFVLGTPALYDMPDIASLGALPDRHSANAKPLGSDAQRAPDPNVQKGHAIQPRKHLRPWAHANESSAQVVGQPREGTVTGPDDAKTVRRSVANDDG